MSKYNNGKIYSIKAPDGECYIGSTIQSLSDRFTNHKSCFKQWLDGKRSKTTVYDLFQKYGPENCNIELIENFSCRSKSELERREGEIIKNTVCVNKVTAGRTVIEYRKDNADMLSNKSKEFYQQNREIEIARVKEYYQEHTEEKLTYAKNYAKEHITERREYKKQYRKEHPDKVREQKCLWRQRNREKVNQQKRELYALKKSNDASCGGSYDDDHQPPP